MAKDLTQYIGKVFRHTPKAVKRGEPDDRLFFVVDVVQDSEKDWLLAWKVTEVEVDGEKGWFKHPAYHLPYKLLEVETNPEPFFRKGLAPNNSAPTAMFRPDSLYQLVKQ